MGSSAKDCDHLLMRVTVAALASDTQNSRLFDLPVTVNIRPSCGVSGEHSYTTDSYALRSMLKRNTELSGVVIDGFMSQLRTSSGARIPAVELNDRTLREIGYFID